MPETQPAIDLTPRERDCLVAIQQYAAEHKIAPSLEDLMVRLDCSKTRVHSLLSLLESRGAIRRRFGARRAIEVVRPLPAAQIVPYVSPYLQRPLRSMGDAMRDMLKRSDATSRSKARLLGQLLAEQQAAIAKKAGA
jgi:SOS-response transcriptional repressor LexA